MERAVPSTEHAKELIYQKGLKAHANGGDPNREAGRRLPSIFTRAFLHAARTLVSVRKVEYGGRVGIVVGTGPLLRLKKNQPNLHPLLILRHSSLSLRQLIMGRRDEAGTTRENQMCILTGEVFGTLRSVVRLRPRKWAVACDVVVTHPRDPDFGTS